MNSSSFFSSHNARRPSRYSGVAGVTPPSPCTPSIIMAIGRRRNGGTRGGEIVERNVPETRHRRLETFFDFFLAGGGDAGERPSVKRIGRGQNFKPAFVVAEFSRELEQAFVRLRAAVGEKNFSSADAFHNFRRQPALRFGEIQIGNVDQFSRLLDERFGDGRMRVAEAAHGDAAAEIEIAFAGDVENIAACAVAQHEFKAAVAGHDVFRKQLADGFVVVADNRRRRWHNFFHLRYWICDLRADLNLGSRASIVIRKSKITRPLPCPRPCP